MYILEGEVLDISLNLLLGHLAADEALDVIDGVEGVSRGLVLGGISDQSLLIGEGDIRGRDTVSLIVDENFDLALLHHTDTAGFQLAIVPKSLIGWSSEATPSFWTPCPPSSGLEG